jgi:hypothetical protein
MIAANEHNLELWRCQNETIGCAHPCIFHDPKWHVCVHSRLRYRDVTLRLSQNRINPMWSISAEY